MVQVERCMGTAKAAKMTRQSAGPKYQLLVSDPGGMQG